MPISLSVPSFSRANATPPPTLRSRDGNSGGSSYSAAISEALRGNPFGSSTQSRSRTPLSSSPEEQKREQEELNNALEALVLIFPDVKIEVFRELLVRFDGNSRLHVCVEQLLRHKEKWVAGRWNVPSAGAGGEDVAVAGAATVAASGNKPGGSLVPKSERFRTDEYKAAVKGILTKEFSGLSRSAVDAVLAEVNFCYVRARPILQDLSRKTWRATLNSILPSFKRKKDKDDGHPLLLWQRQADGGSIPRLKETGNEELDTELHEIFVAPVLLAQREDREREDLRLAEELNEKQAEKEGALYECECCYSDVTFEQISTCSDNMHVICFSCIRHTVHQALFGQGWGTSVDIERSTLKCLAPSTHDRCEGILSAQIVKRAILLDKAGPETYSKFETRLASDALLQSQFKLIRCPFCSYAEVDPVYHPPPNGIRWRFRRDGLISTLLMMLILLDTMPFILIIVTILYFLDPTILSTIVKNALLNLCLKVRMKKFTCANLSCQRASCITCQKPWRDPHVCHEPLLLDLRATVEAARTAAVKRTCPRCGLSFVKSSGCNKLTCTCGYSMCYLCRKALGAPPKRGGNGGRPRRQENINPLGRVTFGLQEGGQDRDDEDADEDDEEAHEGYRHFCEHFRINPGARCTECNKCELYEDEDEEAVARRAGEKAEYEWRIRHQMANALGSGSGAGLGLGPASVNQGFSSNTSRGARKNFGIPSGLGGRTLSYWLDEVWRNGQWKVEGQALVDWAIEKVVVIQDI
ncbi:E3 ubiquitin-protein ligase [Aspergillus lucknowensis]|uniref:RING-type domain-containing protein n=1 Tax=Aspergillus lucknowensis TaxID=176173 RepID=A0ABR4M5T7_9EURO